MKRRRLLTGIGTLAGASSLALGTSAFTSVSAERSVDIDVSADAYGFLRLRPLVDEGLGEDSPSTGRSSTDGQTVEFQIPGDGEGENSNAEGVGTDSIYEFRGLLGISNQGTQSITVQSEYDGELSNLALVDNDGDILRDAPPTLEVGDEIEVGLLIDTHGTEEGAYDEELTIVAERVGGNRD